MKITGTSVLPPVIQRPPLRNKLLQVPPIWHLLLAKKCCIFALCHVPKDALEISVSAVNLRAILGTPGTALIVTTEHFFNRGVGMVGFLVVVLRLLQRQYRHMQSLPFMKKVSVHLISMV